VLTNLIPAVCQTRLTAVSGTAVRTEVVENRSTELAGVPMVSRVAGNGVELIDARELATRWKLPESWVRAQSRSRVPRDRRIPSVRFGRYRRYEFGSARLDEWLAEHRE
jgi:hypothetical protein